MPLNLIAILALYVAQALIRSCVYTVRAVVIVWIKCRANYHVDLLQGGMILPYVKFPSFLNHRLMKRPNKNKKALNCTS